jgi:DNA-binding HxlR family transcriptional regulator
MREVGTIGAEQVQLDACPHLTFAFEILGKRWSALILDLLASRPARFSEIVRAVPGLSDKMLTERLAELTENGLVARRSDNGSANYHLTVSGRELAPALDAIRKWAIGRTTKACLD